MSARGKRLPLLCDEEQSRYMNRMRREILQKILADPQFEGFRVGLFWPKPDLDAETQRPRRDAKL